jgi:hypothetical protein
MDCHKFIEYLEDHVSGDNLLISEGIVRKFATNEEERKCLARALLETFRLGRRTLDFSDYEPGKCWG